MNDKSSISDAPIKRIHTALDREGEVVRKLIRPFLSNRLKAYGLSSLFRG